MLTDNFLSAENEVVILTET